MFKIKRENISEFCISICFAADDNYAPHLKVAIYSLLCNRNKKYNYDLIILHTAISESRKREILAMSQKFDDVLVRFIDVSDMESEIKYDVGAYYSIATNYRLLLFSELFSEYDKMLYLDSDIVVLSDVFQICNVDLESNLIAATDDIGMKQVCYDSDVRILCDGESYTGVSYCTDVLGLKQPTTYINAGVLLLDLKRCREVLSFQSVLDVLYRKHFVFNDQDTLNILFEGYVKKIDCSWNYQNYIDDFILQEKYAPILDSMRRSEYNIVHYIGEKKPWNDEVRLGSYYHHYAKQCSVNLP